MCSDAGARAGRVPNVVPLVVDAGATQSSPNSVARLSTGAWVVAWMQGAAVQAQLLDVSGAKVGTPMQIVRGGLADDGQRTATWAATTTATGSAIVFQRFNAAGQVLGSPTQVAAGYASISLVPVARVTADGGFAVGSAARSDLHAAAARDRDLVAGARSRGEVRFRAGSCR